MSENTQYGRPRFRRGSSFRRGTDSQKIDIRVNIFDIPPNVEETVVEKAPEKKSISDNLKKLIPNEVEVGTPIYSPVAAKATWRLKSDNDFAL